MPDESQPGAGGPEPVEEPAGEVSWRVNKRLSWLKIAGAVVFLIAGVIFGSDPVGLAIGLLAAGALGAYALRDLLAPVRLAADPTGVTVVSGFAGHRHLTWAEIERIRVHERRRFGARNQLLEIDTGDSLHLFSGYELSAACSDVADRLNRMRAAA
jgi:Bacterial PH domain